MKNNYKLYIAIMIIVLTAIGASYLIYYYKPVQKAEFKPTETKQAENVRDYDFEKILPSDPNKVLDRTLKITYKDLNGDGKEEAILERLVGASAIQVFIFGFKNNSPQLLYVTDKGLMIVEVKENKVIIKSPNRNSEVNKDKASANLKYDVTSEISWLEDHFLEMPVN